jgi:hypothetical protein
VTTAASGQRRHASFRGRWQVAGGRWQVARNPAQEHLAPGGRGGGHFAAARAAAALLARRIVIAAPEFAHAAAVAVWQCGSVASDSGKWQCVRVTKWQCGSVASDSDRLAVVVWQGVAVQFFLVGRKVRQRAKEKN